jgi:hypothetical protein
VVTRRPILQWIMPAAQPVVAYGAGANRFY